MKYKWITIAQHSQEGFNRRPVYRITNNKSGEQLGIISWFIPWKQYVFSSREDCVFNESCLKDVLDFLEKLRVGDGA